VIRSWAIRFRAICSWTIRFRAIHSRTIRLWAIRSCSFSSVRFLPLGFVPYRIRTSILPGEPLLAPLLIAFPLGFLERLSRVPMFAPWPPVATAGWGSLLKLALGSFRRLPEPPTLEPLHLRIGMAFLQPAKSRQEVVALGGAE
jgi:hypothetical protein